MFDPQRGSTVLGGPAPRPLAQLPVRLNDKGEVIVAGPFSAAIGVKA
jgi:Rieske Fe-S protein